MTPSTVPCPHCNEAVAFDYRLAGRKGKCPSCHKPFPMPETELAILKQIRDNTAYIRYWIYPIFAVLVLLLVVIMIWI